MKKNFPNAVRFFTLRDDVVIDFNKLEDQLAEFAYKPLASSGMSTLGFEPILAGGELVQRIGDAGAIAFHSEIKIIPNSAIESAFIEYVTDEAKKGNDLHGITKADKEEIRCKIVEKMLPLAFSKHTQYRLMILPKQRLIAVFSVSNPVCDRILALLRKAMKSLPIVGIAISDDLAAELEKERLKQLALYRISIPNFHLKGNLQISLLDRGVITYKDVDLNTNEVKEHISDGNVEFISLSKNGGDISFTLTKMFDFKAIKWSKNITSLSFDKAEEKIFKGGLDDTTQQRIALETDADLHLLAGEIKDFMSNIFSDSAMGGLIHYQVSEK